MRKRSLLYTLLAVALLLVVSFLTLAPKQITCAQYSLTVPFVTYRGDDDGSMDFFRMGRAVGGVIRSDFAENQTLIDAWLAANGDLALFYPAGSIETQPSRPLASGLPGERVTLSTETSETEHFFINPNVFTVFDFWFDRTSFSSEELDEIEASLYWGSQRSDQPDGSSFFTLYHSGTAGADSPVFSAGEVCWYLWNQDGRRYTLDRSGGVTLSGMGAAQASKPLWSPDGRHVVITLRNERITSFFFPLDWAECIVPFPTVKDYSLPFLGAGWSLPPATDTDHWAEFRPQYWSTDSLRLCFSFSYTDDSGTTQAGRAWYDLISGTILPPKYADKGTGTASNS